MTYSVEQFGLYNSPSVSLDSVTSVAFLFYSASISLWQNGDRIGYFSVFVRDAFERNLRHVVLHMVHRYSVCVVASLPLQEQVAYKMDIYVLSF